MPDHTPDNIDPLTSGLIEGFLGGMEYEEYIKDFYLYQPHAWRGKCRCGAFEFRCKGGAEKTIICYCPVCQQRTGNLCSTYASYQNYQIHFTKESKDLIKYYDDHNYEIQTTTCFCNRCGTILMWSSFGVPNHIFVPIGNIPTTLPPSSMSLFNYIYCRYS